MASGCHNSSNNTGGSWNLVITAAIVVAGARKHLPGNTTQA
jgi:hypothetical protein